MNLIVAVDKNWAIGYHNQMLISIPEDMRFFRDETKGKAVIMGRKTFETFQDGKPLKNRLNIVITTRDTDIKDAIVVHSIDEALEAAKGYQSKDIYVIGGESIKKVLSIAAAESDERTYYDIEYNFFKYVRVTKNQ